MLKAQLAKVKATIADKQKAMQALHQAAHEKGLTLNAEQNTQYEALEKEVGQLEKEAGRIEKLIADVEKAQANGLTPVAGENGAQAKATAEGNPNPTQPKIEVHSNLEKGVGFAKFVKCKMIASIQAKQGNTISVADVAKNLGEPPEVIALIEKAATLGTTTDAGFASPLVQTNRLVGEYVELLRANTVLDKLNFRKVPFNVEIPAQATGAMTQWVGEGEAKPLTNPTFADVTVGKHKSAAIVVYTLELLEGTDPAV